MKKRWLFPAVLFAGLLFAGTVYGAEKWMEDGTKSSVEETVRVLSMAGSGSSEKRSFAEDAVIADGVFIDTVDVSGMTEDEALETVLAHVEKVGEKTLTITLDGTDEEKQIQTTVAELGLRTEELSEIVMEAMSLGKSGSLISRYKAEKDLAGKNQIYEIGLTINEDQVSHFLTEKTSGLEAEPVNAELTRTENGFSVSESRTGIKVDVPATVSLVMEIFKEWNREDVTLEAKAEVVEPKYKKEQLLQIQDELGSFSASTNDRSSGKLQNLNRGVELTTGVLIMPGETWSMHSALSPFTAENGYTKQIAYQGNTYVQEYGGGICQLATILYNAALLAEVNISERFNHSMIVNYTHWGLDATINDEGTKDLKLTNDFDFPIYIEGYHNGSGTVTYTIWGKETRPSNRKLEFDSEILKEEYLPEEITVDPNMAPGTENVTQTPYPEVIAVAYKKIYVDGVLEETIELHTDHYRARAKQAVKGPDAAIDPNTGLPVTDPNAQPSDPNAQPTDPNAQPSDPNAQPTDPNAQPSDPNTQPTDPNVQPSDPNAQPSDPNIQPSDPNAQPPGTNG